jgi:hypothetical protein
MNSKIVKTLALTLAAIAFAGCSALSGLTGSTSATPDNPTGLAVPTVATTALSVSVPPQPTVAANCAKGDANSCKQMSTVSAFCKSNMGVQEALKPCTDAGWMN